MTDDALTQGHERETLRMIQQAVKNRWIIPDVVRDAAPKIATQIMLNGKNDRERMRAIELLATLDRDNISALLASDKLERLDSGGATERVEFKPMEF